MVEDVRLDAVQPADFIDDPPMIRQQIAQLLSALAVTTELPRAGEQRLGALEERVGRIAAALVEDKLRLEGQQAQITASDPFETASRLQGEMTRLETIYAVTARRGRLRLTDFIR